MKTKLLKIDDDLLRKYEEIVRAKFFLEIKEDFLVESLRKIPNVNATIKGQMRQYINDPRNLRILEIYHEKLTTD